MGAYHRARGVSLVELLVGTALGLITAAAAAALVSANLHENRRLLAEARLMQDLRTAADIVSRDLRRAGYWAAAASGVRSDDGAVVVANPYSLVAPASAAADGVVFRYSRDAAENNAVDSNEHFGFRLRAGAVDMQLGEANWQALTDSASLIVTAFAVEPRSDEVSLARFCAVPCAGASTSCPPRQLVRSVAFSLSARSAVDASVIRTVRGSARLRNDPVVGSCEG